LCEWVVVCVCGVGWVGCVVVCGCGWLFCFWVGFGLIFYFLFVCALLRGGGVEGGVRRPVAVKLDTHGSKGDNA